MSITFIFRPLVASEASRWSMISSFEARSPFVYSIRIPALSFALPRMTRNYQKAKGLRGHCTGQGEGDARVGDGGGDQVAPVLPCSRNARPEKGLVRWPHLDQHGGLAG